MLVFEHNMSVKFCGFLWLIPEIQHSDKINRTQFKVPFAPLRLFAYRVSEVVQRPIPEKIHLGFLHFHDEAFSAFGFAVNIKKCLALFETVRQLFYIMEGQICYLVMGRK